MYHPELITNERTFLVLRERCGEVFYTDRRLPEKVFRHDFSSYCAFEHGQIMQKEFAGFLSSFARRRGDREVNYMTLDPDPVDYYQKLCGFYGLASFDPETIESNYIKVMYREGMADSFGARGGDVGVLWGESLSWGIFCDRKSWELCLLGSDERLEESMKNELGCMNPSRLMTYMSNMYRNKGDVGREFAIKLQRSYPSLC